ncbi:MAG: glyoxylate reductase, partial [Solirubrobacteraceae bacterium]|nr:glyoxylate reductase [Solirubrobacteraceae bacterium]
MASVFVSRRLVGDALDQLAAAHDVTVWEGDAPPPPEDLRARAAGAEGLLCLLTDRVDAALLDACPRLRVIANYAVGTDNIDLELCAARGIAVGRTPDVLTDATADLAWALLLAVARRLPEAAAAVRAGDTAPGGSGAGVSPGAWRTWEPRGWLGVGLAGRRLLVVGPGRIGGAVARRAEGFGMRVALAGRDDDLHAALAAADVVSLHAPLTGSTRHLLDAPAFAAMKPGALLVNTARGGLVDQVALADALRSGHLAGAGLDVTDPEPLPPDDPLLQAPNLLVLPH